MQSNSKTTLLHFTTYQILSQNCAGHKLIRMALLNVVFPCTPEAMPKVLGNLLNIAEGFRAVWNVRDLLHLVIGVRIF